MYNRRTQFIVGGCAVLFASAVLFALLGHTQAEEENQPFVIRKFAFLSTRSDLAPDYFESDLSVAVTTLGKPFVTHDIMFSPAEEDSGSLAGTEWVTFNTNHTTIENQSEVGVFLWLLDEDTPEPPPIGATTLTGPDSLILSQEVFQVRICANNNCFSADCNGNCWKVLESGGTTFVVVTAKFFH